MPVHEAPDRAPSAVEFLSLRVKIFIFPCPRCNFMDNQTEWEWEISPAQPWFRLHLKELIHYKDLLMRFVRRDILASYQQTILGPLWVFLQPLLTSLVYVLIFHRIVNVSTGGIPALLFYFPGTLIWSFFSDCFTSTMNTFQFNAHLFTKVYFPRLIVPLSSVIFHAFRLSIQLLVFVLVYIIFFYAAYNGPSKLDGAAAARPLFSVRPVLH